MYSLHAVVPFIGYPYEGENTACNLCGSWESTLICRHDRRLKHLRTVACAGCGLLRTDPMPTDDELDRYYAVSYRLDYQLAFGRPPRFHRKRSQRAAEARLELLRPALRAGTRLLDLGSGSGEFLAEAARFGLDPTGIEPGKAYAAYSRDKYNVEMIEQPWNSISFPDRNFSVIAAHHVLEHLNRPVDALRKLAGWLEDDGVLYVSVPDMSPRPRKPAFERFHFAHVYGFTPITLRWAATICGLEPDPRFPQNGTTMVLRKRRAPIQPDEISERTLQRMAPQPAAGAMIDLYPSPHPVRHLVSGKWLADAGRRLIKDVRDMLPGS